MRPSILARLLCVAPLAALGCTSAPGTPADAGIQQAEDTGPRHDAMDVSAPPDTGNALPDLTIDSMRLTSSARIDYQSFTAGACEIAEGCVSAPGRRRLLHFDTWTPNIGHADMRLGDPRTSRLPDGGSQFEFAACHG